jgi:glycosyltransferase involved in cell wall biosynthesis
VKIVHLSTADGGGGAAVAALRLHQGLRAAGADSVMVVGRKTSADTHVVPAMSARMSQFLQRLDRQPCRFLRTENPSLISPAWVGSGGRRAVAREDPDLVHLHWVCSGFMRVGALPSFRAPLLWTLHDMWAFAGGEHYVGECLRYREGYHAGNRPAEERGLDLNRWVWRRKQRALRDTPGLTFLCVSEWLAQCARASALLRDREVKVLYNGIDTTVFRPQPRDEARRELGLPAKARLVLFGAVNATADRRKGFDLLLTALTELQSAGERPELVVFGDEPGKGAPLPPGFPVHALGKIADPARLARVYAACDAMVVPSREEAFGQTAAEALACGTPVVAFRVGGLPEIVTHEVTGFLAPPFDTRALARGIHSVLAGRDEPRGQALGAEGRRVVEKNFSLTGQAEKCLALYAEALAAGERAPRRTSGASGAPVRATEGARR